MKYILIVFFGACVSLSSSWEREEWMTCESSSDGSLCPEWCLRLNRYARRYSQFRDSETRKWREYTKLGVNALVPLFVSFLVWVYLRRSLKQRAEERKMVAHKRKVEELNRMNQMKGVAVERPNGEDVHLDSIVDRPIPEETMQLMWRRRQAEQDYLTFRRARTNQEISDADPKRTLKTDRLQIPEKFLEIDMLPCNELKESKRKEKVHRRIKPVFSEERVDIDWKIAVMNDYGAPIDSSMQNTDMDKTRKD